MQALQLQIEEKLNQYKRVKQVLHGDMDSDDEFLQKGLLKTLRERVQVSKHRVHLFNWPYEDYSKDKLAALSASAGQPSSMPSTLINFKGTTVTIEGNHKVYGLAPAIPEGHVRKYIVRQEGSDIHLQGEFIVKPHKRGTTFIINAFPPQGERVQFGDESPEIIQARVNYAMEWAAGLLNSLDGPPTPEKPIRFRGKDSCSAEEIPYLWTALMILGTKSPHMQFDEKAIQINSFQFDPQEQLGMLSPVHLNPESWFTTLAKKHNLNNTFRLGRVVDTLADTSNSVTGAINSATASWRFSNDKSLHQQRFKAYENEPFYQDVVDTYVNTAQDKYKTFKEEKRQVEADSATICYISEASKITKEELQKLKNDGVVKDEDEAKRLAEEKKSEEGVYAPNFSKS